MKNNVHPAIVYFSSKKLKLTRTAETYAYESYVHGTVIICVHVTKNSQLSAGYVLKIWLPDSNSESCLAMIVWNFLFEI